MEFKDIPIQTLLLTQKVLVFKDKYRDRGTFIVCTQRTRLATFNKVF